MAGGRTKIYSYFGKEALAGGLNISDNPLIVSPSEMTVARNINVAQSLARRKRPGQEYYNTTSFQGTVSYPASGEPIRGLVQYWRFLSSSGVSEDDLFLHSDTKVWSIPNRIDAATDRTGAFTFADNAIPSYQVFQGILYMASSEPATDGYRKWNGRVAVPGDVETATAPADGAPKFLSTYKGKMMAAGTVDFPFRLYYSASLDAEDWSGAGTGSFDVDYDGEPDGITALFGEYQGSFYFATSQSVYELFWPDITDVGTAQINRISKGIGCVGHRMFVQTPNDILFWSYRGLHSLKKTITSDQVEFEFLSRPIQKLVTQQVNQGLLQQGQAVWDSTQNLVITTLPSAGQLTNDVVLTYNITFNLWTAWDSIDARSLAPVLVNRDNRVAIGREDGTIGLFSNDIQTDYGEGFSANFKTGKIFPGGNIMDIKRFYSCTILTSATTVSSLNVEWEIDSDDGTRSGSKVLSLADSVSLLGSTFILGQSTLGIGQFVPYTFTIADHGYNIQLNISASGASDFEYYGIFLEVDDEQAEFS